jgi:putative spermidine/putrescine transport system substrate-binding protein
LNPARLSVAVALAGLALVASACGDSGASSTTAAGPVTVAVTTGQPGEGSLAILSVRHALAPGVTRGFARDSGCAVRVRTVADTSGAARSLTADPTGADVVALPGSDLDPLVRRGLVGAIDPTQVAGWSDLDSHLQQAATGARGEVDALPYLWSADVLLTNRQAFPAAARRSARPVYAPTNGQLLVMPDSPYDLADAALYLGFPDPFALTPSQIGASAELLRRQHPFVRRYTSSVSVLEGLMQNGRVQVALGPERVALDVPGVDASVPHDGVTGRVDGLALSATAIHPECAYRFLSYVLEPRQQAALAAATGMTPVNPRSCAFLGRSSCASLRADDESLESVRFAARPPHWRDWVRAWRSVTGS